RQHLRDLHDRPLQAAQRRLQLARGALIDRAGTGVEKPLARDPGREPAHARADLRITPDAPPEAVGFSIRGLAVHGMASSSSISERMTESPLSQNSGSLASRPKG